MDEPLYLSLKRLETEMQSVLFSLPQEESPLWIELNVPNGQKWKLGALIDAAIWMRDLAKDASVRVYMQGKE